MPCGGSVSPHLVPTSTGTRPLPRGAAGWTMWESLVTLNVVALGVLLVTGLFTSMETARHRAHARQIARKTLQTNLEALARVLRPADLRTLDGFDRAGRSERPLFSRGLVTDSIEALDSEALDGTSEELRWVAAEEQVPGVAAPGRVVHIRDGVERTVAEGVPGGTFSVHWDEGMLVVELATYHTFEDETQVVRGSTSVLVRN